MSVTPTTAAVSTLVQVGIPAAFAALRWLGLRQSFSYGRQCRRLDHSIAEALVTTHETSLIGEDLAAEARSRQFDQRANLQLSIEAFLTHISSSTGHERAIV